jgi:exopolysaccharide production protein ExoQ
MSMALLIMTGSRGAMAALVVAMLGAAAIQKQWVKASVAVVAVGMVSVGLLIGMFGDLSGVLAEIRAAGTLQRDRVDAEYIGGARSDVWSACLAQLADRPFLGFGYGAFWNPQRELKFQETVGWTVTQAHCGYLETALDVGLVGLLMMLAMFLTAVARYSHAYRLNGRDDDRYAATVLIAFLTVMCVESVNATTYITHVLAICMVTRQALGVVLPQQADGRLIRSIPVACTQT